MARATVRFGDPVEKTNLGKHVVASDSGKIMCDVHLELSIDPDDGSVLHREIDVDIDIDSVKGLEERILARREAPICVMDWQR